MKLIENISEVKQFFFYQGAVVLVYNDNIVIGDKTVPAKKTDDYHFENGVLYRKEYDSKTISSKYFRFDGNQFMEDDFRYKLKKYFSPQESTSFVNKDGKVFISFKDKEKEYAIEFSDEKKYSVLDYNVSKEMLILCSYKSKELLFYTKTGERLWEYKVEEGREIDERGVMVVDDIVVIPCTENDAPISVEGYNLLTGEKLWEVDDEEDCDYCYKIGPNKMLYALSFFRCKDHRVELRLTQLNPFSGEVEMKVLKEGEYWDYIHPAATTIHGNKLFYVNQIKKEGCSVGAVDLETKELIDDTPLESQGNTVEKPIVTDDKIYVRIRELNELRIYENEFK